MHTPKIADLAEFSFHARNFCEGVPGVRQAKVTQQGRWKMPLSGFAYTP